jgi:hypothetical protein
MLPPDRRGAYGFDRHTIRLAIRTESNLRGISNIETSGQKVIHDEIVQH